LLITHYNDEHSIIGRFIEITTMPEILCSQSEDIMTAYSNLAITLNDDLEKSPKENSKPITNES